MSVAGRGGLHPGWCLPQGGVVSIPLSPSEQNDLQMRLKTLPSLVVGNNPLPLPYMSMKPIILRDFVKNLRNFA